MTKLGTIALVLGIAAAGCTDDKSTTPTASGVFPASGFAGTTVRVEISGDATNWADGATVDFGTGVTASNVTVASPTDIFADLAIDPAATPGDNDVTVTSNGTYTLTQAFEVDAALDIAFSGNVAQGSVPSFTITNHNPDALFDSTPAIDPNSGGITFPNLTVTGPDGTLFVVSGASASSINGIVGIDVNAGTGGDIVIASGPASGTPVMTTLSGGITITARSAVALTATGTSGMITNVGDSGLYTITASDADNFLVLPLSQPSDPNAAPFAYLLDSSGSFSTGLVNTVSVPGLFGNVSDVLGGAGTFYLVVLDGGTDSGYTYNIAGDASSALTIVPTETGEAANNNVAGAMVGAALPYQLTTGTLVSVNDVDYIKFTTGVVGQHVHVTTTDPDDLTDSVVEVLDGATCTNSLGVSSDADYDEDFISDALTTTTFCVKISASQAGYFEPTQDTYTATVWLQAF